MIVYHELSSDKLSAVLANGIKRTSRGNKGDDPLIIKTDVFLDEQLPAKLSHLGVSRDNNIYAYMCDDDTLIDITDGSRVKLADFIARSSQPVLRLEVDPVRCFVSDLDTYDALKRAIGSNDSHHAEKLATSYWKKLMPLTDFNPGSIRRPEVMITYDLAPDKLSVAQPSTEGDLRGNTKV